jgi:hypothetical protein
MLSNRTKQLKLIGETMGILDIDKTKLKKLMNY